jgi:hypothetical protein
MGAAAALALGLALAIPTAGRASSITLGAADLHYYVGSISVNLVVSQTENACEAPMSEQQMCLRYSIFDEQSGIVIAAGFGLIPIQDVVVQPGGRGVSLSVDTTTIPSFTYLAGAGGLIDTMWMANSNAVPEVANGVQSLQFTAVVTGSILGYATPSSGVLADILIYL